MVRPWITSIASGAKLAKAAVISDRLLTAAKPAQADGVLEAETTAGSLLSFSCELFHSGIYSLQGPF